ncbi:Peroxiredoxin [Sphaceloma murrayae]|uniref:Peroxiredoxin n=1 Tax=Sphaceloma murrayae TaxID=2082308 RepID=A0A2K1QG65_9PEZI|nr:Peroxiredoxin [Sphaceloma murrayae]
MNACYPSVLTYLLHKSNLQYLSLGPPTTTDRLFGTSRGSVRPSEQYPAAAPRPWSAKKHGSYVLQDNNVDEEKTEAVTESTFPADLPVPTDDGACSHLVGTSIPPISISTTSDSSVDPATFSGLSIIFVYPRTGAPGEQIPPSWDSIPGARGCTPQACSFRDLYSELKSKGVKAVYGLSTQDSGYQREAKERLNLPYELLSDEKLGFAKALKLPTFEYQGRTLIKRLTMAIREGKIVKVWYPVFPPAKSADEVMKWLDEGVKAPGST